MAKNWNIDPVKKDYVLSNGAPVQTDSLTIPSYIRLRGKRLKWLYAPDSNWGSDFYAIQKNHSTSDPSLIEHTAGRALQPLIDDGRATQIDVTTIASARSGVGLEINVTDSQGQPQSLKLDQIG